jgi:CTP-dependent riboflavin kinase
MITIKGRLQQGVGDFRKRMTMFPEVFRRATGETLIPGTLKVRVDRKIPAREDFRIRGIESGEPDQDLLFEKCLIDGIPGYRIRPFNLRHGDGGHGDDVIELSSSQRISHTGNGAVIEITFFRDSL